MLNDKTNKLLISKAGETHQECSMTMHSTYVRVCVCMCLNVYVFVFRVASHRFPACSGVQVWAQSNHSSVNILYYYNLGYAFNCACHKRDIYTHTHTHTAIHTHSIPPTLEQLLLPLCQALSSMSCSWWEGDNPFVCVYLWRKCSWKVWLKLA